MDEINFARIPPSEVHPVTRYGYDPIPGNHGEYWWDEQSRTYKRGKKPREDLGNG